MRLLRGLVVIAWMWHGGWASAEERAVHWQRVDHDLGETHFTAVAVYPPLPTRVFAASRRTLYESMDGGRSWQQRFHAPADTTISQVAIASAESSIVLVATDHGLYGSFDGGIEWIKVFHGLGEQEANCTHVEFHPQQPATVLVGTRGGLFISDDHGRHWKAVEIPSAAREVIHFVLDHHDPNRAYLVTAGGFFIGNLANGQWQQRVRLIPPEEPVPQEPGVMDETNEAGRIDVPLQNLSAVALDPHRVSTLYLAGSNGLQRSIDGGHSWHPLPQIGLEAIAISRLVSYAHSPLILYAATARGVACYEPDHERWQLLTDGLAARQVNDLAVTPQYLWAATNEGLYRAEVIPEFSEHEPAPPRDLLENFVNEPTIGEVREVAIRYAEVHPHKIAAWRTQARLRALLPKLSFTGTTNSTDLRHWDTGPNPDVLLRGKRDLDWGANVSWDLGDVIWSADQTSIDVRSKLMVELRDDIVDTVTRLYFERRRLQVVLLTDPPKEPRAVLEQELRIQELTALLDGLTGGYFSKRMRPVLNERSSDGKRWHRFGRQAVSQV